MNIFARARPSIARAIVRMGPGLATPLTFGPSYTLYKVHVNKERPNANFEEWFLPDIILYSIKIFFSLQYLSCVITSANGKY